MQLNLAALMLTLALLAGCKTHLPGQVESGDANAPSVSSPAAAASNPIAAEDDMIAVHITVGNRVFAAKFHDNPSARAIAGQMPFTLDMGDYARQEKVTELDFELPAAPTESPATVRSGELYLWSGNQFVLFYTTFSNSYSYVRIGYIEDTSDLMSILGTGNVSVTFSAA